MIFEGRGSFLIGFEGFLPGFRVRHLSRIRVLFRGRNPRARVQERDVQVARLEEELARALANRRNGD
jgi:hypothetical protein